MFDSTSPHELKSEFEEEVDAIRCQNPATGKCDLPTVIAIAITMKISVDLSITMAKIHEDQMEKLSPEALMALNAQLIEMRDIVLDGGTGGKGKGTIAPLLKDYALQFIDETRLKHALDQAQFLKRQRLNSKII